MRKLEIFKHEGFGEVRVVTMENEPYFVGKDVAEILGYKDTSSAILDHIDEEDRVNSKTQGCFAVELGQRGSWLINESGLYSLILSSKLPSAKKFKRWVTSEVLPQIRKTGGYIPVTETMTEKEIMARALQISQKTIEEQQKQLEQQKPLINAYKQFLDVGDNMDFGTLAKNIGIGRNKLMAQLRDWKVLMTDEYTVMGVKQTGDKHNVPYQKYMDKRFFVVKNKQLKTGQYKAVTLVTPLGATAIAKELKKRELI